MVRVWDEGNGLSPGARKDLCWDSAGIIQGLGILPQERRIKWLLVERSFRGSKPCKVEGLAHGVSKKPSCIDPCHRNLQESRREPPIFGTPQMGLYKLGHSFRSRKLFSKSLIDNSGPLALGSSAERMLAQFPSSKY